MLNTRELLRKLAQGFHDDAKAALDQATLWDARAREFSSVVSPREGLTRAVGSMDTRAQDERRKAERALQMATAIMEAHDAIGFAEAHSVTFAAYRESLRAEQAERTVIAQQDSPAA